MQGAEQLGDLLLKFDAHPLVAEILIINNSDSTLRWRMPPKAREIYRGPNLYVNPAWNLGAEHASSSLLAIVNDDIDFEPSLLDHVAEEFERREIGMLGPAAPVIFGGDRASGFRTEPVWEAPGGYGVMFFVRRDSYEPIPGSMRIYAGEYWLFWNQARPNRQFLGSRITTVMHTTSGRSEFSAVKQEDVRAYHAAMAEVRGTRSWHRHALRMHRLDDASRWFRKLARRAMDRAGRSRPND